MLTTRSVDESGHIHISLALLKIVLNSHIHLCGAELIDHKSWNQALREMIFKQFLPGKILI